MKVRKYTILLNKAQCLHCGDIVESKTVHDFVWCKCQSIFVDGGKEYLKRGGEMESIKELSEWNEEIVEMRPQDEEFYIKYKQKYIVN